MKTQPAMPQLPIGMRKQIVIGYDIRNLYELCDPSNPFCCDCMCAPFGQLLAAAMRAGVDEKQKQNSKLATGTPATATVQARQRQWCANSAEVGNLKSF